MELPTYTSIWRIEKRLYKLYDFRLPMPLPVGQIVVFATITVPYVLLLTFIGLPFSHSLFWLYVLPPGALTWLATRPVLESKRLPELALSQLRYLAEPSTWCRMAPVAEHDEIIVEARVWRRLPGAAPGRSVAPEAVAPTQAAVAVGQQAVALAPGASGSAGGSRAAEEPDAAARPAGPVRSRATSGPGAPTARGVPAGSDVPAERGVPARQGVPGGSGMGHRSLAGSAAAPPAGAAERAPAGPAEGAPAGSSGGPIRASSGAADSPAVVVVPAQKSTSPPGPLPPARAVERALSGPAADRSVSWRDRVLVVPGGRGPRRPDFEHRDMARAVLPLREPRLVVMVGCTVGAGQTVTTLMLADLLASLRGEPVAALDANPGPASLVQMARTPAIMASTLLAAPPPAQAAGRPRGRGRLDVIVADAAADGAVQAGGAMRELARALRARYQLALADPGAPAVARMLTVADQLVLVAPASPDASRAVAMTCEWLAANGFQSLAARSIAVVNGVSKRSLPHAQQAEMVVRGRCRAIVRIPWDDHLAGGESEQAIRDSRVAAGAASRLGQLRPPVRQAYTALAGVLVAALADSGEHRRAAP